jgi:GNAT superfamily N-acetyltransferase
MNQMIFREAEIGDIPQIQVVRNAVTENTLSNPDLVPDKDVADYITNRGKGWVCEVEKTVVGFAIVSIADNNVWALFIQPGFDKKGIGKKLHDDMMDWYFSQTSTTIWLSTTPGTRADQFYCKAGWVAAGEYGKGEIKFEMSEQNWRSRNGYAGKNIS